MNTQKLLESIKKHEGVRLSAYRDTLGILTIGAGCITYPCDMTIGNRTVSAGDEVEEDDVITRQQADMMMEMHLSYAIEDLQNNLPWVNFLPEPAKEALTEMVYQLGISRFMRFEKMLAAVRQRKWGKASWEAIDSRWYKQTPVRVLHVIHLFAEAEG